VTFEYERLVKERTSHRNRIKALLFAQGVRDFDPMARDRLERQAALPIPPRLKAELGRECRRLARIVADIAEIEAEMAASATAPSCRSAVSSADKIAFDAPLDLLHPLLELGAGEVLVAGVHRLELAAVDRRYRMGEQVQPPTYLDKPPARRADRRAVVPRWS